MATFHAIGRLDLTIMVNELGMIIVFEHCFYAMFVFQPGFLHVLKTSHMILITLSRVLYIKFL